MMMVWSMVQSLVPIAQALEHGPISPRRAAWSWVFRLALAAQKYARFGDFEPDKAERYWSLYLTALKRGHVDVRHYADGRLVRKFTL